MADCRISGHGQKGEILLDILIVTGERQLHRRRQARDPFASRDEAVVDIALFRLPRVNIRPVAAVARYAHRNVSREPVAPASQIQIAADKSVIAGAKLPLARGSRTGVARDDLDDAACRIATEQRSLRSVQDLDPVNPVKV